MPFRLDRFTIDAHEMVGERTGAKYRLGDRVTIKVARVDLETTKIDFSLVNKQGNLELAGHSKGQKKPAERQSRETRGRSDSKPSSKPKGPPKSMSKKTGGRHSEAAKPSSKKSTNSRKKSTKKKR